MIDAVERFAIGFVVIGGLAAVAMIVLIAVMVPLIGGILSIIVGLSWIVGGLVIRRIDL